MLHHDAVMCLSTETDPAKFRALVVIDQIHRLEATVNHGGLWLETIGLIEEVLAPLPHELHFPAEAVRHHPSVLPKLLANCLVPQRNTGIGLLCIGVYQQLGLRLWYLVLESKPSKLHIIVKAVVRLLASLTNRHDTGKERAGQVENLWASSVPQLPDCNLVCVSPYDFVLLDNQFLRHL